MADIEFDCPKCNGHLAVDEKGAGLQVKCPDCGDHIVIPTESTDQEQKISPISPTTDNKSKLNIKLARTLDFLFNFTKQKASTSQSTPFSIKSKPSISLYSLIFCFIFVATIIVVGLFLYLNSTSQSTPIDSSSKIRVASSLPTPEIVPALPINIQTQENKTDTLNLLNEISKVRNSRLSKNSIENLNNALTRYPKASSNTTAEANKIITSFKTELALEKRNIAKGLVQYKGIWMNPSEVEALKKEMEIDSKSDFPNNAEQPLKERDNAEIVRSRDTAYAELRNSAMKAFSPLKNNSNIKVFLLSGIGFSGTILSTGSNSVTIKSTNGELTFQREQLSQDTRQLIFLDDYVNGVVRNKRSTDIQNDNAGLITAMNISKNEKYYDGAIKIVSDALQNNPFATQNVILEAKTLLTSLITGKEYTAKGFVSYNGYWMTPAEKEQIVRKERLRKYTVNGNHPCFPDSQSAWRYADSQSRNNVGSLDALRESVSQGGTAYGNASMLDRFKPTPCPIHPGKWTVSSFSRDQNIGLHDAISDTLW